MTNKKYLPSLPTLSKTVLEIKNQNQVAGAFTQETSKMFNLKDFISTGIALTVLMNDKPKTF